MNYSFPHIIRNCVGEKIVFQRIEETPEGDRLLGESFCEPGCGPVMHTHFKQDEGLTVLSGKMGYQLLGEKPGYALPGETVVFKRGTPHRFWAEGEAPLHCKAWITPINTILFYLTAIYAAQNKSGSGRPELFDGAYLMKRYASEYDLVDMPILVKRIIIPATYLLGKLLGKYKHFADAPEPVK
jgi:quercetin dioxygenase-like cupin family protein